MLEDNLSPQSITDNLGTRFIGQKVIYYPSVSSTNSAAKQEARWGALAGTAIVAEEQTEGRGRLERTWLTPKGCVAVSIVLRPNISSLPKLIMLASVSVVRAIERTTGLKPGIKWPNDVLIGGKKVCGILIENEVRRNSLMYTIVGIGINVNLQCADLPDVAPLATSLSEELGKEVSRLEIVRNLLIEMDKLYPSLPTDAIFEHWQKNLVTLGKVISVKSGEQIIEGTAESVSKDGNLFLRQQDGSLFRIVAGDATILRK